MVGAVYLSCFGLLSIISVFLVGAWFRVAYRRGKVLRSFTSMYRDRYMVLASALCINAVGTCILFGARLLSALLGQTSSSTIPGFLGGTIAFAMSIVLFAKFGFMWAIELNRADKWWRLLLALSIIWVLFCFWYELWYMPDQEALKLIWKEVFHEH